MNCVYCEEKMRFEESVKTCSCCNDKYHCMTYICDNCEIELSLTSVDPIEHSNQQVKRGIGKTN